MKDNQFVLGSLYYHIHFYQFLKDTSDVCQTEMRKTNSPLLLYTPKSNDMDAELHVWHLWGGGKYMTLKTECQAKLIPWMKWWLLVDVKTFFWIWIIMLLKQQEILLSGTRWSKYPEEQSGKYKNWMNVHIC